MPKLYSDSRIDWNTFYKRKRMNVVEWLRNKKIKNYQELCMWCELNGVIAPNEQAVEKFFVAPTIKMPKKVETPPEPTQSFSEETPIEEIVNVKEDQIEDASFAPKKTKKRGRKAKKLLDKEE